MHMQRIQIIWLGQAIITLIAVGAFALYVM
jgi:hypothetical protein